MNINSEELQQCYDEYLRQINKAFKESLGEEAAFDINSVYVPKFNRPLKDLVGTSKGNTLKRYGLVSLEDIFKLGVLDNKFSYRIARNRLMRIPGIGSKTTEFLMREVYPVLTVESNGEEIVYSVNDNPYLPDCKKESLPWCRKFKKRFYSADPTKNQEFLYEEKIMNETWSSFIERTVERFGTLYRIDKNRIYKWIEIDESNLENVESKLSLQEKQHLYIYLMYIDFFLVLSRQDQMIKKFFTDKKTDGKYLGEFLIKFYACNQDPFLYHKTDEFSEIKCSDEKMLKFREGLQSIDWFLGDFFFVFLNAFQRLAEEILDEPQK